MDFSVPDRNWKEMQCQFIIFFCFNRVIPLKELFHQSILWLLTDDSPSQLEKMIGLRSNICTSLIRNFKKSWTIFFFRFWPSMFGRLQCIVHMVSGVVWCWPGGRFQRKPNVKSVRDDADLDRFIFFFMFSQRMNHQKTNLP